TTRNRLDLGLRLDGKKAGGRLQPSRIHETMKLQISFTKLAELRQSAGLAQASVRPGQLSSNFVMTCVSPANSQEAGNNTRNADAGHPRNIGARDKNPIITAPNA